MASNVQNLFVGRKLEIDSAMEYLSALHSASCVDSPRVVMLYGEGGSGKSKLAVQLATNLSRRSAAATAVIDIRESRNRTVLGLLHTIAAYVSLGDFAAFCLQVKQYDASNDVDRNKYHRLAVEAFVDCSLAFSARTPIVIVLDTLELVHGTNFLDSVLSTLLRCGGRIGLILAGRADVPLACVPSRLAFKVSGFLVDDIRRMAQRVFALRGKPCSLPPGAYERLLDLTDGKPILCGLAIDWLVENPDQTQYIVNLQKETFEREITLCLRALDSRELDLIELMSIAVKRFDPQIACILSGTTEDECHIICERMKRFSFVRIVSGERQIALHDEVVRLVRENFPVRETRPVLDALCKYYARATPTLTCELTAARGWVAEYLYYLLLLDTNEGVKFFDGQVQSALESFDYDLCALLISEMEPFLAYDHVRQMVDVSRAEILLSQYKPREAKRILDALSLEWATDDSSIFSARVTEGYGNVIINACTVVGADLFHAVECFKRSQTCYHQHDEQARLASCLLSLGKAYVYIGRHVDAEQAYMDALSVSKQRATHKLSARILDEMGKMYRLQQSVEKSLHPLEESFQIRTDQRDDKNLGVYYYYLANTYRDLDLFDKADTCYKVAEECLVEVADSFRLCEMYCDRSWRYFLSGDYSEAEALVQRSWELAKRYEFGTEYSEYYHIKYEIAMARREYPDAYLFLDQALEYARKYSNIYMILDCLNHCAQRAYAQREYARIPEIITEMKRYEGSGCGIKVFTGRAIIVLGDVHYDAGEHGSACQCWKEGLTTVALYGNSRSNVELLSDILQSRRDRIRTALALLGDSARSALIGHWRRLGLHSTFPELIEVCVP